MRKSHVAIITWHYYQNFGSALQAYALQESIINFGFNVSILDYRDPKFGHVNKTKDRIKILLSATFGKIGFLKRRYNVSYVAFQRKYMRLTPLIQDPQVLPTVCNDFDAFVCGSDQIWAPNVFNPIYMLNFVPDNKKKISYAASIGLDAIPYDLAPKYRELLSRFHAISIRESTGAELLRNECDIASDVVLDPTLLIDVCKWKKLERKPSVNEYDNYIFCYFLNEKHGYQECVQNLAQKNGYKILGVSAKKSDDDWMNILDIGPQEFLWLIHHAKAVITDSYHGTVFSLLYHKKFICLERFSNNDVICQNSRIYQLNRYFGLEDIITRVTPTTELKLSCLDYDVFETTLKNLRDRSLHFLKNALEN